MKKKSTISISKDARENAVSSLRTYAAEHLDEEMGDLKAGLLLDFILEEIGPTIHNQAISGARAFIEDRAADLDAAFHQNEFPGSARFNR